MKNLTMTTVVLAVFALATTASACDAEKKAAASSALAPDAGLDKTWVRSVGQYDAAVAASAEDQPVMVVYTVAGCGDCKSVQANALADAGVVERLNRDYTLIHVDLTLDEGEMASLLARQQIQSVPAVRFLEPDGDEMVDLRLDGRFSTETLTAAMDRAESRKFASR